MTIENLVGNILPEPGDDNRESARPVAETRRRTRHAASVRATPILHFLSTQPFASPFDINMAVDAGFKIVIPHVNVGLAQTTGLIQDAIFSRPPHYGCRTGVFIGGKDALLALDMLESAKQALVPPFQLSAFADPGGSFTTAAAMVACVERVLQEKTGQRLKGARVVVFGSTGVVGFASTVIAALEGARVRAVTHMGMHSIRPLIAAAKERFGVEIEPVLGARDNDKKAIAADADVILCAAAAGVRVLTSKQLRSAKRVQIVADVNAVPPSGIEGVELFDNGRAMAGGKSFAIGPLAIGNVKYQTQAALLKRMRTSNQALMLDFRDAFDTARRLVRKG